MPKLKHSNYDPSEWRIQSIEAPFELFKIPNVFSNQQYLTKLQKELNQQEFYHNRNDMFSLSQTKNFTHLVKHTKIPMIQKFLQFLNDFKSVLAQKMNIDAELTISASSSKYCDQDFLLCHDDNLEDRLVAFIYYINPSWKKEWGGSLDIFDHDSEGQPTDIVQSIFPEFNSLIFFPVGKVTHHQVSEVVSDEAPRLTINGWFHSKSALSIKPLIYREPPIHFSKTHSEGIPKYLHRLVNAEFLEEGSASLISSSLCEQNALMLQNFLKPSIFKRIEKELCSSSIRWKRKGPASRSRYDVADEESLPSLTTTFLNFVKSKYMCSYLESITGHKLFRTGNENGSGLVNAEIQSWKNSNYSLLADSDPQLKHETVEIWLFFNVQSETNINSRRNTDEEPGHIYYCKKNSVSAEYEIEPANNSICLVHKQKNITMFVSYISAKSSFRYNALRIRYKL